MNFLFHSTLFLNRRNRKQRKEHILLRLPLFRMIHFEWTYETGEEAPFRSLSSERLSIEYLDCWALVSLFENKLLLNSQPLVNNSAARRVSALFNIRCVRSVGADSLSAVE